MSEMEPKTLEQTSPPLSEAATAPVPNPTAVATESKYAKIRPRTLALIIGLASLFGGAIGGGAGYYAALTLPVSPAIAVVDVVEISKAAIAISLANNEQNPSAYGNKIAEAVRVKAKELASMGVVVIDKTGAVIDAPEELTINSTFIMNSVVNGADAGKKKEAEAGSAFKTK